jgi:hypothetical protein
MKEYPRIIRMTQIPANQNEPAIGVNLGICGEIFCSIQSIESSLLPGSQESFTTPDGRLSEMVNGDPLQYR